MTSAQSGKNKTAEAEFKTSDLSRVKSAEGEYVCGEHKGECSLALNNMLSYLFIWGFTLLSTLYRSYHDW